MRNRSKVKPTIGPLVDDKDSTVLNSQDLVEELNKYFASVFMEEDLINVPCAKPPFYGKASDRLLDVTIIEEIVRKQFDSLRTDKAAGADDMSPRVMVTARRSGCCIVFGVSVCPTSKNH